MSYWDGHKKRKVFLLRRRGHAQSVTPSGGIAPLFSSAEIGSVNAFTLPVTFDSNVSASNYATGVTIKVNGTATSITSATRQANHAIVRYVIPVLWHGTGDAVTWEYNSATGNIVSESDATPLGDVSAQSVTNNCEYIALLDLQSDDASIVSPLATWADQSGQSHDFTQSTDNSKPTKQTIDGYPAIVFDGANDWMDGGVAAWCENPLQLTVIMVKSGLALLSKSDYGNINQVGWQFENSSQQDPEFIFNDNVSAYVDSFAPAGASSGFEVQTTEKLNNSESNCYRNGAGPGTTDFSGTITDLSSSVHLTLGASNLQTNFNAGNYRAIVMFSPIPNPTNRAALETRLGARYGLIVP